MFSCMKYTVFVIVGLLVLSPVYAQDETAEDALLQEMVSAAQRYMDTPLKATYVEVIKHFYPKSYIIEYVDDEKARIEISNVEIIQHTQNLESAEVSHPQLVVPIDKESGLPHKTTTATVEHYLWREQYYVDKELTAEKEGKRETYIYDGGNPKDITYYITPANIKKPIIYSYPAENKYLFGTTVLSVPFPYSKKKPEFRGTVSLKEEGTTMVLSSTNENQKATLIISPEESYMVLNFLVQNDGRNSLETKVNKVIKINDLYLPGEIERKTFDRDGSPKIFVRFSDISWEVISQETFGEKISTPLPEEAKIIEF